MPIPVFLVAEEMLEEMLDPFYNYYKYVAEKMRKKLKGKIDKSLENIIHKYEPKLGKTLKVRVINFEKNNTVFCFGSPSILFPNLCVGYIFIENNFRRNFSKKELEWILLHETGHIVQGHTIAKLVLHIPELLESSSLKFIKDSIKLFQLAKNEIPFEEKILKTQEFEADEFATNLTNEKVAFSVLSKLQKMSKNISHTTKIFGVEYPYLFISERIERVVKNYNYRASI